MSKYRLIPILCLLIISCSPTENVKIREGNSVLKDSKHVPYHQGFSVEDSLTFPHYPHNGLACNVCHTNKSEENNLKQSHQCGQCHTLIRDSLLEKSILQILQKLTNEIQPEPCQKTHEDNVNNFNKDTNTIENCYYQAHPNATVEELNQQTCAKCHN